jgi:hypothetical protein
MWRNLFSFPNPVNEVSARLVAGGVVIMAALTLILDARWLTVVIAYGFLARVATGPTLSPLGQFVTRVVTPLLPVAAKPVPGPPKRFAQGMGAVITTTAAVLWAGFGLATTGKVFIGLVLVAATLESVFAFCVGCVIFGWLMRANLIPASVCEECADITVRRAPAAS